MALSTAEQVRLRIQDKPTIFDLTMVGDGSATIFGLGHTNVVSATAFVPGGGGWSATGATVDPTGFVQFSSIISEYMQFRVRGVHTVFSDDEIGHFTAVGGGVVGAALEAVGALMFDSLKRAKWAAPDGTQYDDTMAQQHLQSLHDQLVDEVKEGSVDAGSYASWALGQEDW